MICPHCGEEMNHHAEKLTEPTSAEEAKQVDPVMGGVIEEVHACAQCGTNESQRAVVTKP